MKTTLVFFIFSLCLVVAALSTTTVYAAADGAVLVVPASRAALQMAVDLPKAIHGAASWQLVEIDKPGKPLATQTITSIAADGSKRDDVGRIVATIPPTDDAGSSRRFRLEALTSGSSTAAAFAFSDAGRASLRIAEHGKPVLVYNYGVITNEKVPATDTRRSRACYIHPLWGLNGEVLTDDFPADHYHHHGVFWAWPHVEIANEGTGPEKLDLWEYQKIGQRFVRWLGRDAGPLAAVLGVENGWFVADRKVMVERVWIQVANAMPAQRALDIDFTLIPVDRPIALRGAEGKSYGGLTIRFTVKNEKDSTITVPTGASPQDLPDTPLPWADLTSRFAGAKQPSGAAIFIPRDHPDYPPTWLTRHYGALCVGWPGVNGKTFAAGKPIRLHYRIWIHAAAVDVAALKSAYAAYQSANEAHWE